MDAKEIFNELISNRLRPIVLCYEPYQDEYKTYPYYHIADESFEKDFSTLLFDSIVFYAYEKNEIEHEYKKGRLKDLHKAARTAYENRVQKTEKKFDGLMGELALDAFLKCFFSNIELLYSRVKYCERIPRKEAGIKRKGHEIKGYDGMVFSCENGQKCIWVGQVKTGDWKYCFDGIKEDINKRIKEYKKESKEKGFDPILSEEEIKALQAKCKEQSAIWLAEQAEDARKAKESKRAELEQSKQEKLQQLSELSNTKAVLVSIVNTIVFLGALVGIGVPIGEFDGALLFLYIMFVGVGGGFVGLFIIWGVIYDRMKEKIEKKRWSLEGQIKSISNELSKLK